MEWTVPEVQSFNGSRDLAVHPTVVRKRRVRESHGSRAKLHGPAKAEWLNPSRTSGGETSNTCEEHFDTCKAGAAKWIVHNFETNNDLGFQELEDTESSDGRPTSESDSDDFDYGALMDRNDQRRQMS